METSLLFLLISLGVSLLYLIYKLLPISRNARIAPGPAPLPIIGNLFDLDGEPHSSLARLSKIYGPVMSLKLGLTTSIIISSPEAAREVLQKKDLFFSARSIPDSFRALNLNTKSLIWLPSTSALWKQLRAISSTYLFSQRCLESTRELREKKAREIMQHLRRNTNRPVDIGRLIFNGILNIISNILFSEDVVDIDPESTHEFKYLISESIGEAIKPNVSDLFPFLRLLDLQGRRRRSARNFKKLYDVFDDVIDRRLTCGNTGGTRNQDFLDSLLELHADSKIDRQTIKNLLSELFGAGTDTSAITAEWAVAELLHDPVILAKAQSEVRETFPTEDLKESDTTKLPYLRAVIKEVMRMHPGGPLLLPHEAMEEGLELGGFMVPKGARVLVNIWAIGRDPKVWDEPNVFRPERFLEKDITYRGKDCEFIPFGYGRRICPGMELSTRVIPFVLALMLHEFDWKLPNGMAPKDVDLTEKFMSVLELAAPLHLVPVSRGN